MLIASTKIPDREGKHLSLQLLWASDPTINHTCQPYLPWKKILLLVSGVAEQDNNTGLI